MAGVIWGYICEFCGGFSESKFEAEDCCRPEIRDAYQCSECEDTYFILDSAVKCCPDYYDEPGENECAV